MTDMTGYLTCDTFADRLADYLEGDLSEGSREAMDAHASTCDACRALLRELESVTRHAASLPRLVPSRDLWPSIAERIDASVLPMTEARPARIAIARRTWNRPAIAAAALVIVTAGVTHVLTRASLTSATVATTAPVAPTATASATGDSMATPATPVASVPDARTHDVSGSPERGEPDDASAHTERTAHGGAGVVATASSSGRRSPVDVGPARGTTARLARAERPAGEPVYDREISQLRDIVRERRSQLDPRTVAVLEQSVAVIDSAIAQSRAALARDPASGLLATQLNHSLEKKVELLRTAALLPARS